MKVILTATYILWLLKLHYNQAQDSIYQIKLRLLSYYSILEYIHQHGTCKAPLSSLHWGCALMQIPF